MKKWYDKIKRWYDGGAWTKDMVHQAYEKGLLTAEEYEDITGEQP